MDTEKTSFDDAEKAAQSFAWDYFAFHAQQRQTVFNFFIILNGASLAAFAATIDKGAATKLHFVIGCVLAISSFLFWRLDERSRRLIQLAEAALKEIEIRLAARTGLAWLTILTRSDNKIGGWSAKLESFTQIYRLAFIVAGCSGLGIILTSIF
ncbi:hypothetical protein WDM22_38710 [Bradyrhizobium septentrionale]|uniref:RipA family octameric membrane protein n=1 Tax=Bradyrhizobium septentrionale TaxID=1404411 RepID=UPI0030D5F90C